MIMSHIESIQEKWKWRTRF